jgi:hypothetical protein
LVGIAGGNGAITRNDWFDLKIWWGLNMLRERERKPKSEDRGQKTEDRRQKTEEKRQKKKNIPDSIF